MPLIKDEPQIRTLQELSKCFDPSKSVTLKIKDENNDFTFSYDKYSEALHIYGRLFIDCLSEVLGKIPKLRSLRLELLSAPLSTCNQCRQLSLECECELPVPYTSPGMAKCLKALENLEVFEMRRIFETHSCQHGVWPITVEIFKAFPPSTRVIILCGGDVWVDDKKNLHLLEYPPKLERLIVECQVDHIEELHNKLPNKATAVYHTDSVAKERVYSMKFTPGAEYPVVVFKSDALNKLPKSGDIESPGLTVGNMSPAGEFDGPKLDILEPGNVTDRVDLEIVRREGSLEAYSLLYRDDMPRCVWKFTSDNLEDICSQWDQKFPRRETKFSPASELQRNPEVDPDLEAVEEYIRKRRVRAAYIAGEFDDIDSDYFNNRYPDRKWDEEIAERPEDRRSEE